MRERLYDDGTARAACRDKLAEVGGEMPMADFVEWAKTKGVAVNEVLKWGEARGWIERAKGQLVALKVALSVGLLTEEVGRAYDLEQLRRYALSEASCYLDEIRRRTLTPNSMSANLLSNRPELAKIKQTNRANDCRLLTKVAKRSNRIVSASLKERNTLTPEDLESGAWREIKLRPYDVTLAARTFTRPKFTRCGRSSSKRGGRFWKWASPKSPRR